MTLHALLLSTCLAAAAPERSASLSPEERKAAVDAIASLVSRYYVFPEKRAGIVDTLRNRLASGAYDELDGPAMAARLTDDLHAAGQDGHLWVKWSPELYEARRKAKPGAESTELEVALGERLNQG